MLISKKLKTQPQNEHTHAHSVQYNHTFSKVTERVIEDYTKNIGSNSKQMWLSDEIMCNE